MLKSKEVTETVDNLTVNAKEGVTVKEVQDAYLHMGQDLAESISIDGALKDTIGQCYGPQKQIAVLDRQTTLIREMEKNAGQKIQSPEEEDVLDRIQAYVLDDPKNLSLKEIQFALSKLGEDYLMFICEQNCMTQALHEQFHKEDIDFLISSVAHVGNQPFILTQEKLMAEASAIMETPPEQLSISTAKDVYMTIAQSLITLQETQNRILESVKQKYGQDEYDALINRVVELEKQEQTPSLTRDQIDTYKKIFGSVINEDMLYDGEREE